MRLNWYETDSGWNGEDVVTLARIRYAEEGEAEGGIGALLRFMAGALHPHVGQARLSPAGWYWQGTVEQRGVWCRPRGPFKTHGEAREDADRAFKSVTLD